MITVSMDPRTVARVRVGAVPAFEVTTWLKLCRLGRRHPVFGAPTNGARAALRDPDVALVAATLPDGTVGYTPDLFTPKPLTDQAILDDQLERVRATPDAVVIRQCAERFERTRMPAAVRRAVESGTFARRAADGLRRFWRLALADLWPHLVAATETDLAMRTTEYARSGVGALLGSLSPQVRWTGEALELASSFDGRVAFADTELVVAPSALAWDRVHVQVCDPADAVLYYPVRSPGAGRAASFRRTASTEVTRLLGETRACLLVDLDRARTTSDLSARLRLAPATVSYHLGILHSNGLISRRRDRRTVLYRRTDRGDELLSAAG